MNYLFVVAHPDDEVLGAGGTICKLVEEGHKVGVCILSCVCKTREDKDLIEKIKESHKILGVHKTYFGEFECISINKAPHYEVVEYIEKAMIDFDAQVIFTHHPNDTNIDHYTVSEIVGEASRLSHRQLKDVKISPLQAVYYMEIPSSTDWSFNAICKKFEPNTFVSIRYENIDKKIKALEVYDNVIREMPHPRSVQALIARSYVRGSECGSDTGYADMELFTSFHKYLWKRLIVISAEDCYGIMTKEIIALYQADQIANEGRSKADKDPLFAAKAIVLLCIAKKNRDGCYFACNFMLPDKTIPEDQIEHADVFEVRYLKETDIPDYVFDCHTIKGKRNGKTDVDMAIEEQDALKPHQMSLFDDCNWSDYFENAKEKGTLSQKEIMQYEEKLKPRRTP